MTPFSRRNFLQLAAAGLSAAAARPLRAIEPFKRIGQPRLRLSLAAYSLREFFKETAQPAERRLDIFKFIDYCAEQGCDGAELTSYYFPKDVTPEYLRDVRRYAFLRGVEISGTSVGNNFALPAGPERDKQIADVKKWIDYAAILGAPHIRIFAGSAKGVDPAEARRMCISAIEECCAYAGERGIFLGLENHGGIVAEPEGLLEIVKAVKSPWFGVNLDTGNFHTADPYAALAQCAPYAVNVQIKVEIQRAGGKPEPSDIPKLVQLLRAANYQGWVALEYEAKEDPWNAIPRYLGEMRKAFAAGAEKGGAEDAAWTPLFDGKTLNGWKETNFGGSGGVSVENGELVLEAGNDLTGVNYTGQIPTNGYEVALEAKRVQGSDFFCGLTFPIGDTSVTLVLGGWGGGVMGISSINGDDASENETTVVKQFETGRWYRVRVRVTDAKLEAWLDDDQVVNVTREDKRFGMRAGEIELSKPFGVASYRTRAALKNIKIRRVS